MNTSYLDVRENITSGRYDNKMPYPSLPKLPPELKLTGSQLTNDQIAALPEIKRKYEDEVKACKAAQSVYQAEENARMTKFENDCAAACGLTNHPKRSKVYGLAWDYGHSSGLGDVYSYYENLAELVL